jgi:hypothetical protein
MNEIASNSKPLRNNRVRSTRATEPNSAWWFTQKIRIVPNETTYAARDGSWWPMAAQMSVPAPGTCSSSTSRVAAMAITPSLNASTRPEVSAATRG